MLHQKLQSVTVMNAVSSARNSRKLKIYDINQTFLIFIRYVLHLSSPFIIQTDYFLTFRVANIQQLQNRWHGCACKM